MAKRDLRKKLVGHHPEESGELITRDVSRSAHCDECGAKLDIRTLPMTSQVIEECRRCGWSQPVRRFVPLEEEKEPDKRK
jgi:hypothetical protein